MNIYIYIYVCIRKWLLFCLPITYFLLPIRKSNALYHFFWGSLGTGMLVKLQRVWEVRKLRRVWKVRQLQKLRKARKLRQFPADSWKVRNAT